MKIKDFLDVLADFAVIISLVGGLVGGVFILITYSELLNKLIDLANTHPFSLPSALPTIVTIILFFLFLVWFIFFSIRRLIHELTVFIWGAASKTESQSIAKNQKQLKQEQVKDSWIRRLRLAEEKRIHHTSIKIVITVGGIIFLSGFIGIYFNILDKLLTPISIGTSTAILFWLLVSYGDHTLRKIRVKKGYYGDNSIETYELIQFIKKTIEEDSNNSKPPRQFFIDNELSIGAKTNDNVPTQNGQNGLGIR